MDARCMKAETRNDSPCMMNRSNNLLNLTSKSFTELKKGTPLLTFWGTWSLFLDPSWYALAKKRSLLSKPFTTFTLENEKNDYFLQQLSDPQLARMMNKLKDEKIDVETNKLKRHYQLERNGCLMRGNDNGMEQFAVPQQLKPRILEEMHDSTWGTLKLPGPIKKVLQKYCWDGLKADVENWIQSCIGCSTRKNDTPFSFRDATYPSRRSMANYRWTYLDHWQPQHKETNGFL